MKELTDIQYQIVGCIFMGDYNAAALLAKEHPEYILFAMNSAMRDGYREALETVQKIAMDRLKTR